MQHDYNGFPNQDTAREIAARNPTNAKVIVHRDMDLLVPVFDTEGAHCLTPNALAEGVVVPKESPVIRDIGTTWDIAKHAEARTPVSLGAVGPEIRAPFAAPLAEWTTHVLDMPIKFPGTDVRVPAALAGMVPAIQRIIDTEAQLNPHYGEYYAYVSVHQATIQPGERMRENPFHVDGFQGPRWEKKHPTNHSYLLSDALPTVFYPIGFPLEHLDLCQDDVYAEFAERVAADETRSTWRAKDFDLVLMDAYCVHRGDVAKTAMTRTWLRVSWETRIFDRLGNSHNPLFEYDWEMVARDTDPRIRAKASALLANVPVAALA